MPEIAHNHLIAMQHVMAIGGCVGLLKAHAKLGNTSPETVARLAEKLDREYRALHALLQVKATVKIWALQDRGFDGKTRGSTWDCPGDNLLDAIRLLRGFATAERVEPINDKPLCATYNVFEKAAPGSGIAWTKLGTVLLEECIVREVE